MTDDIKQELTLNQSKWVEALRSGKYKQGKAALCTDGNFCCLGVAAELFKTEDTVVKTFLVKVDNSLGEAIDTPLTSYDGEDSCAPNYVIEALGLYTICGGNLLGITTLTEENDYGVTFEKIADLIESNPDHYFIAKD
jgi:hypothetical protein